MKASLSVFLLMLGWSAITWILDIPNKLINEDLFIVAADVIALITLYY